MLLDDHDLVTFFWLNVHYTHPPTRNQHVFVVAKSSNNILSRWMQIMLMPNGTLLVEQTRALLSLNWTVLSGDFATIQTVLISGWQMYTHGNRIKKPILWLIYQKALWSPLNFLPSILIVINSIGLIISEMHFAVFTQRTNTAHSAGCLKKRLPLCILWIGARLPFYSSIN